MYQNILFILILGLLSPTTFANRPILQDILVTKNLKENQIIRLICSISQGESVYFEWFFEKQKLVESNKIKIRPNDDSSELIIKPLSIYDVGEYKCIGRNKFGEDVQRALVMFNFKPKWTKEPQNVIGTLNQDVTLECEARAFPSPVTRWYKLNDENKQTVIKEFETNRVKLELTKDTSGLYKCSSQNSMGSIEKTINVGYFGR